MTDIPDDVKKQAYEVAKPLRDMDSKQKEIDATPASPNTLTPDVTDIPEDVQKQAYETFDSIRGMDMQEDTHTIFPSPDTLAPNIPEDVQKQAYEAFDSIRGMDMQEDTHTISPPLNTPNPELSETVGKRLADMQRVGYSPDEIHKEMTKDDFLR